MEESSINTQESTKTTEEASLTYIAKQTPKSIKKPPKTDTKL